MQRLKPELNLPDAVLCATLNRRQFLGSTLAVATTASTFGVLRARAAEGPASQSSPSEFKRKIKLGVVGNGGRGCWIAQLFKKHGGYEMWAVADYFQSVADACGDALGVDKSRRFSTLSGYKKVLESGVEAVALETPPYFFPEHASAAVEAGLHVYLAKPVAVDVPGCLAIEAAGKQATATQRVFLVDYQLPTDPHNREIVKQINEGAIGRVFMLNSHYYSNNWPDPPFTGTVESRLSHLTWCNDIALGGGHHVNACIHAIDAALWVAGQRPVSAQGVSRTVRPDPHGDSADVFGIVFQFDGGLVLTHRGKHLKNFSDFEVVCEAQGTAGFATLAYGGTVQLKGPEASHRMSFEIFISDAAVVSSAPCAKITDSAPRVSRCGARRY